MGAWPEGQWEVAGHQPWGVMGDQPGCGRKEKAAGEWCGRLGVGSPVLETEPGFAQAPGTGQAMQVTSQGNQGGQSSPSLS